MNKHIKLKNNQHFTLSSHIIHSKLCCDFSHFTVLITAQTVPSSIDHINQTKWCWHLRFLSSLLSSCLRPRMVISAAACAEDPYHKSVSNAFIEIFKNLSPISTLQYSVSKKHSPVHFTLVSTNVGRFLQYLAQSRPTLREYATQKVIDFLTSPT